MGWIFILARCIRTHGNLIIHSCFVVYAQNPKNKNDLTFQIRFYENKQIVSNGTNLCLCFSYFYKLLAAVPPASKSSVLKGV